MSVYMQSEKMEKYLGKISRADFGAYENFPNLIGLSLTFKLYKHGYVDSLARYCIPINGCWEYEKPEDRLCSYDGLINKIETILKDVQVKKISELIGKPVEVILNKEANYSFEDFRILVEVI